MSDLKTELQEKDKSDEVSSTTGSDTNSNNGIKINN